MNKKTKTILMTDEFWANSPYSLARYYGTIRVNGEDYTIVNKEGKTIFECSAEAEREGREKAIDPGEPADLVLNTFIPMYRKLGRERFIAAIDDNKGKTNDEIYSIMKKMK